MHMVPEPKDDVMVNLHLYNNISYRKSTKILSSVVYSGDFGTCYKPREQNPDFDDENSFDGEMPEERDGAFSSFTNAMSGHVAVLGDVMGDALEEVKDGIAE